MFLDWVSNKVVDFNVSEAGADFVFGNLIDVNSSLGYIFAFKVPLLPLCSSFTLLYLSRILSKDRFMNHLRTAKYFHRSNGSL
jgi:CNT family concentrative nucleoside transporter